MTFTKKGGIIIITVKEKQFTITFMTVLLLEVNANYMSNMVEAVERGYLDILIRL
ncbi:MAG: hypothetical protein FWF76_05250 [Oscillospiraceae bacterium]|nr:hypothetical protein [Oscillospiraceae bacterium]